ncbi:peptidase M13 [Corynebacterium sp. 320]|uniref:M13 family metallopeptidase n=1 Tax=Corynebacterium TaxID=1716 RepID=UPI00125CC50B|nr:MULTISPECIES: M13-type metalloendopeptidase [Corynebacterium]KAB1502707.1 peptidase M13 [Corynebacterium sp. 320]KAB1550555.1 peptidase M13 [Corynebacterium sp. 319]KAB1554718.1 peptidase M13 [Corynebacterium sp. 321]KAB3526370.1 peptidase M13 [Corynebacterium sp. 250]KAB3537785.1 peptidase M13 [Corynebacterium sp. 366]
MSNETQEATNSPEPTQDTPQEPTNSLTDNITEGPSHPIAPTQDLYRHVNGHWLATHTIPADRPVDGTFHTLRDQSEKDVKNIIEQQAADNPHGRIGALYSSFMDAQGIDNAGLTVLEEDLKGVRSASNIKELAEALGHLDRAGIGGVVGYYIEKDSGDSLGASGLTQLYLVQTGLGLPDEAYYREQQHEQTRQAYKAFVTDMIALAQELPEFAGDPAELADTLIGFETALAEGHWDNVTSRDADKTYNPTAIADLPTGFPFATWLEATGVPASHGTIIVNQPSYLEHVATLASRDLSEWKLWAAWRVLTSRAGLLPKPIVDRNWEFYSKTLSGATEQRARWKRGVGLVESQIGEEVGTHFVAEHFPPENKEKMLELVDYLIAAYRERIEQLPWMTDATKDKALAKLEKFTANIGYPDSWRSFDSLSFSPTGADVLANVRAATAFNHDYEVAKLGKPARRDEWFCTPQTVNAFYNPVKNDITFPAAILRPPFFDAGADAAANFGAIGAVIGHEIGHGFDDQGSKFDGDGNLNSWWTEEDRAAFSALTDKLVEQFDGLVPTGLRQRGIEDHTVNGRFTLGENIGDLGGLGIAIVALRHYLADQGLDFDTAPSAPVEGMDGEFTALQRVFLRWARIWQTAIRPQMAAQYASIDPHSPAEFRCNVISSNVAEFYEAFDVAPGDGMWLDEDQRVTIW